MLYGAPGCHLCELAKQKLERVRRVVPFELREVNVRSSPDLEVRFGTVIPVVEIDGKEALVSKVTEFRLLKALMLSRPVPSSSGRGVK
ncbi:MAG TPA: glutaredoxin family protein [Chloroflexota bacterium]|nr:glutaredoxin family protein [Chloroflexota bacterium]